MCSILKEEALLQQFLIEAKFNSGIIDQKKKPKKPTIIKMKNFN